MRRGLGRQLLDNVSLGLWIRFGWQQEASIDLADDAAIGLFALLRGMGDAKTTDGNIVNRTFETGPRADSDKPSIFNFCTTKSVSVETKI